MKPKTALHFLALAGSLMLAGCAAADANRTQEVPPLETGPFAPDTLRALLADTVYVHEQKAGPGNLTVRHTTPDGAWRGCSLAPDGKPVWQASGRWTVGEDERGRATLSASVDGRPGSRLHVAHYDPASGAVWVRGLGRSGQWQETSRGWAQRALPGVAAAKCGKTGWQGLAVDARQTGTTLAALRRQAQDAVLKGLAQPLPGPRMTVCTHRQPAPSRACPGGGKGRISVVKVFEGRCIDWTTSQEWRGGPLKTEEIDDSACATQ